jgi:hypothetical protein
VSAWDDLTAKYGGSPDAGSWDELAKRFRVVPRTEPVAAEPVDDFSGALRFATPLGTIDTGLQLPQALNRRLAQLGSGFADYGLRLDQIRGRATEEDADEKAIRDKQLNNDFTGKALNLAGKTAPLISTPSMGGALTTGALAGALGGYLEPVRSGDSAVANTALGLGLGAAVPAGIGAMKSALRPDQITQQTARKALQYDIPLSPADITNSRLVKAARSATDDIPLVGLPGQGLKDAQQRALNRAVGDTFGARADRLTPDIVDSARKRMGAEFDRVWRSAALEIDAPMFQQLQSLRASAGDLPAEQARRIVSRLDDFLSHARPGANGAPTIPGEAANAFQKWLREAGGSTQSALSHDAATLRKAILDAFNRSNPAEAAALSLNRSQYKAFKTVEPLLEKGVVGSGGRIEGNVPASLLPEAVRRSYAGLASQTGRQPLVDLAQVSGRFLTDRTVQTGGGPRALLQNAGVAGIVGTGLLNPMAPALTAGAGLGINAALNSPRLAKALVSSADHGLLSGLGAVSAQRLPIGLLGYYGQPAP